jgi:ABC-type uncharacterized transport system permease subunit
MNNEIISTIYLMHWIALLVLYILIRSKMKKLYPVNHQEIYGKTLADHSINKSIRFLKFSINKSQWSFISDLNLLKTLTLHMYIAISFILLNIFYLLVFIFA